MGVPPLARLSLPQASSLLDSPLPEGTLRRWLAVSKARKAASARPTAGRFGGTIGTAQGPTATRRPQLMTAPGLYPTRLERGTGSQNLRRAPKGVSGLPRLVSGAPAYPEAELWARLSRCEPRPARSADSNVPLAEAASHATKVESATRVTT